MNLIKGLRPTTTASLSTSAASILGADNNRGRAIIQNLDGSINIYVGDENVSSTNGILVAPGAMLECNWRGKIWAVAASGTPSVGMTVENTFANAIKKVALRSVSVLDTETTLAVKNNKKVRTVVQNRGSESVRVGTGLSNASGGIVLAAGQIVEFMGTDHLYAISDGTAEVQTVTLALATGGDFTLTYAGQTTAAIAHDATGTQVRDALRALSNLENSDVTGVAKSGSVYTVTFGSSLGNVAMLTADASGLTGSEGDTPTVTVATPTQGGSGSNSVTVLVESLA